MILARLGKLGLVASMTLQDGGSRVNWAARGDGTRILVEEQVEVSAGTLFVHASVEPGRGIRGRAHRGQTRSGGAA